MCLLTHLCVTERTHMHTGFKGKGDVGVFTAISGNTNSPTGAKRSLIKTESEGRLY